MKARKISSPRKNAGVHLLSPMGRISTRVAALRAHGSGQAEGGVRGPAPEALPPCEGHFPATP